MKTVQMKTPDSMRLVIRIDQTRIARGHSAHRGGAGQHAHRATKRMRTRGDERRAALRGW